MAIAVEFRPGGGRDGQMVTAPPLELVGEILTCNLTRADDVRRELRGVEEVRSGRQELHRYEAEGYYWRVTPEGVKLTEMDMYRGRAQSCTIPLEDYHELLVLTRFPPLCRQKQFAGGS